MKISSGGVRRSRCGFSPSVYFGRGLLALAAPSLMVFGNPVFARTAPPRLLLPAVLTSTADDNLTPAALVQSEAGLAAAQSQFDNIKVRIAALRSGAHGTSFGLAQGPTRRSSPAGATLSENSLSLDDSTPKEAGAEFSRWGFWSGVNFGNGRTDTGVVSPGSHFDLAGYTAGLDYRHSDTWIFGGAIGVNRQDTRLDQGLGRMDVDGWSVSAYSNYSNKDSWYADSMVSYGHNGYDLRRTIGAQSVTASPDGSSVSFATSIGRDFNKGAWDFGPYGRLQYSRISFDPFVETVSGVGPVVAQAVRTQDVDSLSTVLGGKMTYVHSTDWGVVIPHAEAEWLHEFRNDNPEVVANFVGSPLSSTIVGDPADSNVFKLGVGLSFVLTHGRSGFIYYERLEGNSRVSQQNIALGFRIEF